MRRGPWAVLLTAVAVITACDDGPGDREFCPDGGDLAALVNPFIGTDGSGNGVPGALVPHGMVKLSPDSLVESGSVDSYEYSAERIEGFSHTHLQGPGGGSNGYSHILFLPQTGPRQLDAALSPSRIDHLAEQASPGYYMVELQDYAVRAELTATGHAGLHRYTFPGRATAAEARILIDLGHSRGDSLGGEIRIVDARTVQGFARYSVHPVLDLLLSDEQGTTGRSTIYFYAEFDQPATVHGIWKGKGAERLAEAGASSQTGAWIGAWLEYEPGTDPLVVTARVGISLVSEEQAQRNLRAEVGDLSFDQIHERARALWNCALGRIEVQGGSTPERTAFYTALYHSLFHPADYTEAGGVFFNGSDGSGEVFSWQGRRYYTDDWCTWDTFRTSRPLATLVEPATVDDVIASYLHQYRQGGWLDKCPWHATGYSRVMIGNHTVSIIADAIQKGFRGFELESAWQAMVKSQTEDDLAHLFDGACGYFNLGTPPEYVANGYVSHECDPGQSASMTLEYAYDDWCLARAAEALARPADMALFDQRGQNYRHHFNPASGFMQGRLRSGEWAAGFDAEEYGADFCEATSWIYTWFVPQDVPGLIELLGGDQAFVQKLDEFFEGGHFDASNEPSFHTPFLYNFAGRPDKTQELVRRLLGEHYSDQPNGLPGNDDSGATSAWFVLAALGLYPVAPGNGIYQIGSPLFPRASLQLDPRFYQGREFTVEALDNSPQNIYIQQARLNGEPLARPWLTHQEIAAGGSLVLQMGPQPAAW